MTDSTPDIVERLVREMVQYREADRAEIERLQAEIKRLQAEVNLARSSDIPHLLGMLEAFDRPAPKFIQTNQDRWGHHRQG